MELEKICYRNVAYKRSIRIEKYKTIPLKSQKKWFQTSLCNSLVESTSSYSFQLLSLFLFVRTKKLETIENFNQTPFLPL